MLFPYSVTVFPADRDTNAGVQHDLCIADAVDIFQIYDIRSMCPYKEHGIQELGQITQLSVKGILIAVRVQGNLAQMGFEVQDLLKWNMILCPFNMKIENPSAVCEIAEGIGEYGPEHIRIYGFGYKTVGQGIMVS